MDDLFYFTPATIGLDQIEQAALAAGFRTEAYDYSTGRFINVFYEEQEFWQWHEMHQSEGHFDYFEPGWIAVMSNTNTNSAFMISLHYSSLPQLALFLRDLLAMYGGWISADTQEPEPFYTADALVDLARQYPEGYIEWLYEEASALGKSESDIIKEAAHSRDLYTRIADEVSLRLREIPPPHNQPPQSLR